MKSKIYVAILVDDIMIPGTYIRHKPPLPIKHTIINLSSNQFRIKMRYLPMYIPAQNASSFNDLYYTVWLLT